MLNSIEIRNYKNLKHLKIETLGKVNLVTGKNNTGKSTLLEAISIYSSRADITWLYQILEERGEVPSTRNEGPSKEAVESNIKSLSSIFSDRKFGLKPAIAYSSESLRIRCLEKKCLKKNRFK